MNNALRCFKSLFRHVYHACNGYISPDQFMTDTVYLVYRASDTNPLGEVKSKARVLWSMSIAAPRRFAAEWISWMVALDHNLTRQGGRDRPCE